MPNLNKTILYLRQKLRELNIDEIFIIFPFRNFNNIREFTSLFDSAYDLSEVNLLDNLTILYYSGIIYKNIIFNNISKNFQIYRTNMLEINSGLDKNKLKDYAPEKYYILNKVLIEWIKNNYNNNNKYIFINSWNNYEKGNYLKADKIYGYASINSFSKALFNLPYKDKNITLYNNNCNIAVQVHIYYEDLLNEVINYTNNIPIKYDLYITTTSYEKKIIIEEYIRNYSKANKYEIIIVKNKGRDVLPLIIQLKEQIKKYKYFCHIHTKKSAHDIVLGNNWRNYLYKNLLGSKELITEIISDFEKFDKLGFIFPEVYYEIIKKIDNYDSTGFFLHRPNINYMNLIIKKIFHKFKIGYKLIFPSGNMFWAKFNSVYQIFNIRLFHLFPKELNQTNETIMHAIERIWLYLVKLNGYYYKTIFKYY